MEDAARRKSPCEVHTVRLETPREDCQNACLTSADTENSARHSFWFIRVVSSCEELTLRKFQCNGLPSPHPLLSWCTQCVHRGDTFECQGVGLDSGACAKVSACMICCNTIAGVSLNHYNKTQKMSFEWYRCKLPCQKTSCL